MKHDHFISFRKYPDPQIARDMAGRFEGEGIRTRLVDNTPRFDPTFSQSTAQYQYEVQVKAGDVARAAHLLEVWMEEEIADVTADYYLMDFTDDELYDVLFKRGEWSPFDYRLAMKLLTERGKSVSPEELNTLYRNRFSEMAKPDERPTIMIITGYVFLLLAGIPSIFIGYSLLHSTHELPDGKRISTYGAADRRHGQILFYTGITICVIVLAWRMWRACSSF